jgi:hypothetical protein
MHWKLFGEQMGVVDRKEYILHVGNTRTCSSAYIVGTYALRLWDL